MAPNKGSYQNKCHCSFGSLVKTSNLRANLCCSSLCSSSSFSSSCSGTRSSLVSRLDWVCGRLHSVGLLSNTCCRGTLSPALKSDTWCTGIVSFSWSGRESSSLRGCLKEQGQRHTWSEDTCDEDVEILMTLNQLQYVKAVLGFSQSGKDDYMSRWTEGSHIWITPPVENLIRTETERRASRNIKV